MIRNILILFMITIYGAKADFITKKSEGWHWYEKSLKEEIKPKENPIKKPISLTPTQLIEALKRDLETKLHRAIVYPTLHNVKTYKEAQKAMVDQSDAFSKTWVEVTYLYPHLDETLKNPSVQAVRHIYHDKKREHLQNYIKVLAKDYGLFFFYKSGCSYCHQFAPIVQNFSQKYGWPVLAISMDGSRLKEFPDAQPNNGAAEKMNIQTLPSLMAVNPKTGEVVPLSFGMTSQEEMEDRIQTLLIDRKSR